MVVLVFPCGFATPQGRRRSPARDRSQKLPINKFPDSKGQWHPFTVRRPFFYVKFSSENANPSYWGYRFIVSVRSVASEVALELLEAVLRPPPHDDEGTAYSVERLHL